MPVYPLNKYAGIFFTLLPMLSMHDEDDEEAQILWYAFDGFAQFIALKLISLMFVNPAKVLSGRFSTSSPIFTTHECVHPL